MISSTPSRRAKSPALDLSDLDEIARIVRHGKESGLIKAAAPTTADGPLTKNEIIAVVQEAKASGALRDPGQPVPIQKNGVDVTAAGAVRSQWMDVDPTLAKHWLENNFRNRPVSEDVVKAYAWDMANGDWVPTHQGVAFNDQDELIDGQHRLLAIIRSGATIRMMVTFGLASKIEGRETTTMDAVDRGRTRSVSDQLKIQHGFKKDATAIAAITAQLGTLCAGERTRRLSVGQTLDIFRAFEPSILWVLAHRSKKHGLRAAGVLAAFAFALATECGEEGVDDQGAIARLFELVTGEDAEPAPATAGAHLRAFLTSPDAQLLNRGTDRGLAELVLQAIHLDCAGHTVHTLEPGLAGAEHFRAAQPERVRKIWQLFHAKVA